MIAKSNGIKASKRTAKRAIFREPERGPQTSFESGNFEFLPRYARVAQSLIEDIAANKHPIGTLIATETELCERFLISRNTARSALAVLSDMGLVTRHAGIGTVVRSLNASPRYVQEAESLSALFPNMESTEMQTLSESVVKADASLARLLDCRRGEQWSQIETLRSIRKHKIPVAYSRLYLPKPLAHLSEYLDHIRAPAYTVINQRSKFRVAKLIQETSACPVSSQVARRLGVEEDSPGLQVIRRYFSEDGKTVLVSDTIYPAGRYSFSFAIKLPR